jgi:hypothetical protein
VWIRGDGEGRWERGSPLAGTDGKAIGVKGLLADFQNRGQYSDAVLNELESQNDGQVEGIMGKVRQLKDVCPPPGQSSKSCLYIPHR